MQISLLRKLIFYDENLDKFIWRIPPPEIFTSDHKWQHWCHRHVGQPVATDNGRLVIFDYRPLVTYLRAAWTHPDPTVSHGLPRHQAIADTLRSSCGVDAPAALVDAVCLAIDTIEPGPPLGQHAAALLTAAGFSEQVAAGAAQVLASCGRQWALPWRGRRAGRHTRDLHGMAPGDTRDVDAPSPEAALALARRHKVPSPRVVELAPDRYRVEARAASRRGPRARYDWDALAAPGGSIWVAAADLPASGIASIRTSASVRGWRISCRREGAGYRVVRRA